MRLREERHIMAAERTVELRPGEEFIRLGQLLKYTGVIDRGSDVRDYLATRAVTIDGRAENRRGAKIRPGQVVATDELIIRVCASAN